MSNNEEPVLTSETLTEQEQKRLQELVDKYNTKHQKV